jgi:adenylate cyclase
VGDLSSEEQWREILTGSATAIQRFRRVFRAVPTAPRCKLCHAPYGGAGGLVLRPWFGPWERNAQLCKACFRQLNRIGVGGAEVELSMLFADVRGSTGLGERLRPSDFSALLGSFYRLAADAIVAEDGIVDKFVGDEAIGLFITGYAGADHAGAAIRAGRRLLEAVATATASATGPIPVGAGVHTGVAFVGTVGSSDQISDFTALGDAMNTTARLSSLAAAGELLVSVDAVRAAGRDGAAAPEGERRTVEVRGREATLEVVSIRVTPAA